MCFNKLTQNTQARYVFHKKYFKLINIITKYKILPKNTKNETVAYSISFFNYVSQLVAEVIFLLFLMFKNKNSDAWI